MPTVPGIATHRALHARPVTGHEAAWRLFIDLALTASMRCPR